MDQIKDIYKQGQERLRLAMQHKFLKEQERPVYGKVLAGREGAVVLDLGCNDGVRTVDRFGTDGVSKVIGLEYHRELVEQANRDYGSGKFSFYQENIEGIQFEESLWNIMEASQIDGFDVANLSFVLMHLKRPERLLSRVKKFLKPGGILLAIEADDRFSRMSPDTEGRMGMFLEFCEKDMLSGNRRMGADVPDILRSCGYQDVTVHSRCICALPSEREKKEQMFEIAFSYLPEDYASLCRQYPEDPEYARIKGQIEEHYGPFQAAFVGEASETACGMVVVTGLNGKEHQ